MLQFGLRLGDRPRQVVTTTPRPIPLLKRLPEEPGTRTTRLKTAENRFFLAPTFLDAIVRRYAGNAARAAGTRCGNDRGARPTRCGSAPRSRRRASTPRRSCCGSSSAIDPPASSGERGGRLRLVAAGIGADGRGYVLADGARAAFAGGLGGTGDRPLSRARRGPDRGGEEPGRRDGGGGDPPGGRERAGPDGACQPRESCAGRADRGALRTGARAAMSATLPALEDEMCDFGLGGLSSGRSPDRVDALVWALSELMLGRAGRPGIRGL